MDSVILVKKVYYPNVGSRFERSKQISTVDVMGGEVIDVYLPGVRDKSNKTIAKAIVVVAS